MLRTEVSSVQLVASVPDSASLLLFVATRARWLVHPNAVSALFLTSLSDTEVFLLLGFSQLIISQFVAEVLLVSL